MLRLIHNQTVQGAILVDDIDDGLPNKEVHRLGSLGNPKAYERDGYANKPKQPCYVPYSHTAPNGSSSAGFITLQQTNKVTLSSGTGKISKLVKAGLLTELSGLTQSQFAVPLVSASVHGSPTTITGTTFLSVAPDVTSVTYSKGAGATLPVPSTLTAAQIITAGGTVTATSISIPAAAFTTAPVVGNGVYVTSNENNSNTVTLT